MKKDCFELESNASRRPKGWKSIKSSEAAGAAAEELSMLCYECDENGEEIPLFCKKCNIEGSTESDFEAMKESRKWINRHLSEEEKEKLAGKVYPGDPPMRVSNWYDTDSDDDF